jgi:hypothetical protein
VIADLATPAELQRDVKAQLKEIGNRLRILRKIQRLVAKL